MINDLMTYFFWFIFLFVFAQFLIYVYKDMKSQILRMKMEKGEQETIKFDNVDDFNKFCKENNIPFEVNTPNSKTKTEPQPEPKPDTPEVKFIKSQRTMWLRMCYASFAFLIYALYNDYSYDIYLPIFGLAFFFIYKIIKLGMEHPETLEDNDLAKKYFQQKNKK